METDKKISKELDPTGGKLLGTVLIVLGIANLFDALAILLNQDSLKIEVQHAHISILYIIGILSIINVALLFGIHEFWSKRCVHGFYLVVIIKIIIVLFLGVQFSEALKNLGAIVILFLAIWDYRKKFT